MKPNEQKEVERRLHRSAVFQRVFKGKDGEAALAEIDDVCNFKSNAFDPDPYKNAYIAGQRSIAVFIHTVLEQDVEGVKKILQESKNE